MPLAIIKQTSKEKKKRRRDKLFLWRTKNLQVRIWEMYDSDILFFRFLLT